LAWDEPQLKANLKNPINRKFQDYFAKTVKPFRVPLWGLSPVLQSIWTIVGRYHPLECEFKRDILSTHSNGTIAIDWLLNDQEFKHTLSAEVDLPELAQLLNKSVPSFNSKDPLARKQVVSWCKKQFECNCSPFEGLDVPLPNQIKQQKPVMVLVPGLTNCSDSHYIRSFVSYCKENGWIPVVYIWRGLGGLPLTSPRLFEPGDTRDFEIAVKHIKNRVGNRPIAAIGWSLGANLLCKYLGEHPDSTPFFAAASIGQGYDAAEAFKNVPPYILKRIGSNFQLMVDLHKHHFSNHDLEQVLKAGLTVQEFDERFTLKIFDQYKSVDQYYKESSCRPVLKHVSIPLLLVNAKDDPVVPPVLLPYSELDENENLVLVTTNYGGHLGFAKGFIQPEKYSWADEFCLQWFQFMMTTKKQPYKKVVNQIETPPNNP